MIQSKNTAKSVLGLGIVGLGRIANAHIDAARSLPDLVNVVAVATRNPEKREAAGLESSVAVYGSAQELVKDPKVDAVVICTPNYAHSAPVEAAANAGKHVLVEKPIALSESEASSMVTQCEQARVTLMVAQSRRFSRAIQKMRTLLGELGVLYRADIDFLVRFSEPPTGWWTRSTEAGELILHLQASHSLDTFAWLFEGLPNAVYCQGRAVNPVFGGVDEANITMQYAQGLLGSVRLSLNTSPAKHKFCVYGENGTLVLEERPGNRPFSFAFEVRRDEEIVFEENGPSVYTNQLQEFLDAISTNREPIASGREVLKTAKLLDAAIASYRRGRVVDAIYPT